MPASSSSARDRTDGNKRQSVEIQGTHVGPDLQFATAAHAHRLENCKKVGCADSRPG